MIVYLSGATSKARVQEQGERGIGLMLTPAIGYGPEYLDKVPYWAADTGCFSQPEKFTLERYWRWLDRMGHAETCLFATAPDVVGDAVKTWERSEPVLPLIRARGLKAALVAQDGLEDMVIDWDALDCLFIGGTTAWKLGRDAEWLVARAKALGKRVHMGRVNSATRLTYAASIGCDSADGTYMCYNPGPALAKMSSWLNQANGPRQSKMEVCFQ